MKKLAVLAMAGLISATASAVDWVLVEKKSNYGGFHLFVDVDSITDVYLKELNRSRGYYTTDKYKQAFVKSDYIGSKKLSENKTYNSAIELQQFDCKSNPKKSRTISVVARQDGNLVAAYDYHDADFVITYPETIGRATADFVCSR